MPITIDEAYIQTFESNVRHLAQQGSTLLRSHVTEKGVNSEKHNWDRLAPSAAVQKVAKRVATPYTDPAWSRRVSVPQTWHWADSYEEEDIVQMLIDPSSSLTKNGAMAMARAIDDQIIAAALAAALEGDGGTSAFPAGQVIGDYTGELDLNFVLQVNEKFITNDISLDIPKCFVIGPTMVRKLLLQTEVNSADYQSVKALAGNGYLPNFLGFNWVVSNRLNVPLANQLDCLAFSPYALGLQVNSDIKTQVAQDPSNSFLYAIYMQYTMGCVRVEDEHIVHAKLASTVTP